MEGSAQHSEEPPTEQAQDHRPIIAEIEERNQAGKPTWQLRQELAQRMQGRQVGLVQRIAKINDYDPFSALTNRAKT